VNKIAPDTGENQLDVTSKKRKLRLRIGLKKTRAAVRPIKTCKGKPHRLYEMMDFAILASRPMTWAAIPRKLDSPAKFAFVRLSRSASRQRKTGGKNRSQTQAQTGGMILKLWNSLKKFDSGTIAVNDHHQRIPLAGIQNRRNGLCDSDLRLPRRARKARRRRLPPQPAA
jgi:hypothetical protein